MLVNSSFNNRSYPFPDRAGNVLACSSGGKNRIQGFVRSTPFAAQMAAAEVAKVGAEMGIQKVGCNC